MVNPALASPSNNAMFPTARLALWPVGVRCQVVIRGFKFALYSKSLSEQNTNFVNITSHYSPITNGDENCHNHLAITITTFEFDIADQLDVDIKLPRRTGHHVCRENHLNILSWGVLQKKRSYSSFGEYNSSNWDSVFFLFLQLWSVSIFFLLSINLVAFLLSKTLWACTAVTLTSSSVLKPEYDK